MSGLNNLNKRLNYKGGNQEGRMIEGKLRSLKKALLYSYQAATAQLEDGRQFRCLINDERFNEDYDKKVISIPYEDICINSNRRVGKTTEGYETIGMKVGDIFTWVETQTDWIVVLEYLEEDAYFRAQIYRCTTEVDLDGKAYKAYMRGPRNTDIHWHTKQNVSWNDTDFDVVLYIKATDDTKDYFQRFSILKIDGKPWEVQTVDSISMEGILYVRLKEAGKNSIQEAVDEERAIAEAKTIENNEDKEEIIEEALPYIDGNNIVYPYDQKQYFIRNLEGGIWSIDNTKKAIITYQTDKYANVTIISGKTGDFNLIYRINHEEIKFHIQIKSL